MIQILCDWCKKDCGRNAYVVTVEVIHNPVPVYPTDIGSIKITDTHTTMKMCLCERCYEATKLPNIYEFEQSKDLKFREEEDEA